MGSPTAAKATVAEYRMSMHYGVCHGPVDAVTAIHVGDKPIWTGEVTHATLSVDLQELFGGRLKEGGVSGQVNVLSGHSEQLLPPELSARLGGSPTSVPGFRGYLSLFFNGFPGGKGGFLWGANSPYVKAASVKVRRSPKGFYPERAMIGPDANPAHIIYECLTNTVWGMGGSPAQIDADNFRAAADVLYGEGMGLSMMWSGQTTIESFVQEVLDHIEATFFTNPKTGLINIKLIRQDFDVASLFHVTDENSVVLKFQRKGWGETINEINASWTNPENEQEENVTVHDLGNIASQGEIVPSSRNYYGVRRSDLALRMAQRDLAAAAFPIASCEVEVDRSAWAQVPGGVVKLSSSVHGVSELVMRVGTINYGRAGNPKISVTLVEDVFALPLNPYVSAPGTEWQDPTRAPEELAFHRFSSATYYTVAKFLGDAGAEALTYPQAYVVALGAQYVPGTISINLMAEGVDTVGTVAFRSVAELPQSGRGLLAGPMAIAPLSTLPSFSAIYGNVGLETSIMVQIGSGTDAETELAIIESVSGGVATLRRGILDTVPKAWPAGTEVWLFRPQGPIYDPTARAAGQTISYKLLPRTTRGLLDAGLADIETFVAADRLHRPYRPANVKANGVLFGPDTLDYEADGLVLTWSNRNRLMETNIIMAWDAATVTPEDGQTTRVTIYNADNSVLQDVAGLTGTSFTATFDPEDITGDTIRYVVRSSRDGLLSLQSATKTISII